MTARPRNHEFHWADDEVASQKPLPKSHTPTPTLIIDSHSARQMPTRMSATNATIAPRPLFVESGEKDNIFPIAASVESFKQVREIYGVFQATDRVEQEVFPGEHSFWGKRGVPFLARHLTA